MFGLVFAFVQVLVELAIQSVNLGLQASDFLVGFLFEAVDIGIEIADHLFSCWQFTG